MRIEDIEQMAMSMRKRILTMAQQCETNVHLGGSLSMVDVLAVLYGNVLRNITSECDYYEKDKFILSKGHGALGLYCALAEADIMPKEELVTFQKNGSNLIAHPVMNLQLGLEASNGSLGQGISMAVGLALAAKKKKKPYGTYVLVGNGECNEGIVWEAAMAAAQFQLDNLTVIIDNNQMQSDGASETVMNLNNFEERFRSFGFYVVTVDGHNIREIQKAFEIMPEEGKPKVIVANTVKGKGISFMEQDNSWHHNRLTEAQYEKAMAELEGDLC